MWIETAPGDFAFCDRVIFAEDAEGPYARVWFGPYRNTVVRGRQYEALAVFMAENATPLPAPAAQEVHCG